LEDIEDAKLTISIKNTEPINLIDLTEGLKSLAKLYSDFSKGDKEAGLFVKKVSDGSIIIDLITNCIRSVIPLISNMNNIVQFCQNIELFIKIFKKDPKEKIQEFQTDKCFLRYPTKEDAGNFKNVLKITKNLGDSVTIQARDISNVCICTFTGEDSKEMQKNMITEEEVENHIQKKQDNYIYEKQLFRWVQTNFNNLEKGNRGKIERITKKPLKVIFENEDIKRQMTSSSDKTEWQNKYYIVDVEVSYDDGKPKLYKILHNYTEDSFPI